MKIRQNRITKSRLLWIPFLLIPFSVLAQNLKPSDFHGIMRLEDNKTIDFTSLNNPADGTNIAFYTQKPDKEQYLKQEGRKLLSFGQVVKIKLLPLTKEEAADLRSICGDGTLQKATLTLKNPDKNIPEIVYIAFKMFEWRSTVMQGFPGTYTMEARFLDEIEIQQNK
jgi:hypothetical protein